MGIEMQIDMYIDGEEQQEKKRLLKAGGIILWIVLIGVSMILASQAMVIAR